MTPSEDLWRELGAAINARATAGRRMVEAEDRLRRAKAQALALRRTTTVTRAVIDRAVEAARAALADAEDVYKFRVAHQRMLEHDAGVGIGAGR